ncbi:MAG: M20/M25/M40 family metallo-hydrolase [bacterium JZ-2024 1]
MPSVNGESERSFANFFRGFLDATLPRSILRIESETSDLRPSFIALKPGHSRRWLVLLGHYDTVGVSDYGPLANLAFDPSRLRHSLRHDPRLSESDRRDLVDDRYMWARGALDMKAGIAVLLEVLSDLSTHPQASLALVVVPDEEGDSEGIKSALPVLLGELKARDGKIAGVIKADFTEKPGVLYAGTVGKLLLNLYVRGIAGHAGKPDTAVSAASVLSDLEHLIRRFSGVRSPSACLHLQTLIDRYSAQTPVEGWMYVNILVTEQQVGTLLNELVEVIQSRLGKKVGLPVNLLRFPEPRKTRDDPRQTALNVVRTNATAPGIYLYLSPPYYPSVAGKTSLDSLLGLAVRRSVYRWNAQKQGFKTSIKPFYPYISDLSFFGASPLEAKQVQSHCPIALGSLPFFGAKDKIPVFDIGPCGTGAHRWNERVNIEDAKSRVKSLIANTILHFYEE